MTKNEWLKSTDPRAMLKSLRGRESRRKLILFCLTWCPLFRMERANGDPFYDIAMRFAEVGDNRDELRLTCIAPDAPEGDLAWPEVPLAWAMLLTDPLFQEQYNAPPPEQAPPLLREFFGNPFRPVAFDPQWRTSTALALARGMYDSRDFSAMPILADALQDADCDSDDILNHCRDSTATHVRGCWVVDLVLGKE